MHLQNFQENMNTEELISFVWPYYAAPAQGKEIFYSIKSVEKNFHGKADFWIIGDRPEWYHGNFIEAPRINKTRNIPRFDRASKLLRVLSEPRISEEFVWMMDDIYFVNPIKLDELRVSRSCGHMTPKKLERWKPRSGWLKQKKLTWKELHSRGRTLDDYATHMPQIYTKTNVHLMSERYDMLTVPYVDDLLYGNEFATEPPRPVEEIFYRECGTPTQKILEEKLKSVQIFNHCNRSFTSEIKSVVEKLVDSRFYQSEKV